MELIFPTIELKQKALEYRQEHFDNHETEINGDGGLDEANTYEEWLDKIITDITRDNDTSLVPATTYFGMHNGEIIGTIQIRHKLNEHLMQSGGHIGYGIRPSERRKGYATQMLKLALDRCREMGIGAVLITCDKQNTASAKTIIKNGGIFEDEFVDIHDGNTMQRYWVNLVLQL
ncbi:MAG: GNAT family N-acetyltransferase [Defluviitaleaceae bacterium]|nr:GNAT family N-acetyltransferase [Defluviitaleaceae bacterium]